MAFQLSPAVEVKEQDLTLGIPAVATSIGAVAGGFQWGPVDEIRTVFSEPNLVAQFGKPNNDVAAYWFSAANFLAYGNNLKVVRVVGNSALNATNTGTGVLVKNDNDYERLVGTLPYAFVAKYAGVLGNGLEVHACDEDGFDAWEYKGAFDSAPSASGNEIHIVVVDGNGDWTGVPNSILEKYEYVSTVVGTKSSDGTNIYFKEQINRRSKYVRVGDNAATALANGLAGGGTATGTASVPESVSQGFLSIASETEVLNVTENFESWYTVVVINQSTLTTLVEGTHYTKDATTNTVTLIDTPASSAGDDIDVIVTPTAAGSIVVSGSTFDVDDTISVTLGATPLVEGTHYTRTAPSTIVLIDSATTYSGGALSVVVASTYYSATLTGAVDDNTGVDLTDGYSLFQDAETVDIQLFITGPATMTEAKWAIDNVGEYRKDCVVFVSPDRDSVVNNPDNEMDDCITYYSTFPSSSYAFADNNWKYQYDKYNDVYRWVPLNGDIAGLAARTDDVAEPWFSPAGYSRGQIKNVVKLAWNAKKTHRDELYKNRINAVCTFAGDGTVLFGDKTMLSRPSAFSRINVRRLFITLEKAIATAAKFLLFEFNDDFTRAQFVNFVEPYLRDVQGRRGIYDFRVKADETNNTGEVIDRNEFIGDIYIKPARSINYITLNFIAVRTDVTFEEVGA